MVVCPWNEFWQHYSPWAPSDAIVQEGISVLENADLDGNEWAKRVDPSAGPNENAGFKSLQDIAWKLQHMENMDRHASYTLVHRPNRVPLSTISSGNHMTDGCFYPSDGFPNGTTAPLELRRTASVHEYKTKSDPKRTHDASLSYLWHHFG